MKKVTIAILSLLVIQLAHSQPADKKFLLGQFDPATHDRFVQLDDEYTNGGARGGYLLKETYEAFVNMAQAARKENVILKIVAATRTFATQKMLWENKWTGKTLVDGQNLSQVSDIETRAKKILQSSSMPGTSRFHWGTDVSINNMDRAYFKSTPGLREFEWLNKHAASFGFCEPYPSKTGTSRSGYEDAPWQWSFTPLSSVFLSEYNRLVHESDLTGFLGWETVTSLLMIRNYVDGVACTPFLKKDPETLLNDVMNLHDEVMPKMENLYALKVKAQDKMKQNISADQKKQLEGVIADLDLANDSMMNWMHQFTPPPNDGDPKENQAYLEIQKLKMEKVKEIINTTIASSTTLIK